MSGRQITTVATHTARSIRRRLSAAARERRGHPPARARPIAASPLGDPRGEPEPIRDHGADDARLDTLRGELVHELDRLAAADQGCSAGFRRI
ncbi:MAG: hypothetical protein QOG41_667 [Thermoleophilaceae bacterium]|jgi:hypothetical protein|nr:hypothetical protein [Thermoleophilaceae bacterium]MEA2351068.1 hypothetical protein [Thermoleophilaceae bacterium]MEA2369400.1 hypothetical protein [Thermoleophilaceae bacterium]MEA2387894.1 hypothetical protein [Thermoleophilaceae bacterium]